MKRVLAVHDLSCIGRCSLTAALPIISAQGCECVALPTAVLSTQTGGIDGYTCRDLTEDLGPILDHWGSLGIGFDCIYTGFLASPEQISIAKDILARFGDDALVVVDPVMADFGRLYGTFGPGFPSRMRSLCSLADVIVPNVTEAFLLLGRGYRDGPYSREEIRGILDGLYGMTGQDVVLTGVSGDPERLGVATFQGDEGEIHDLARVEGIYHGSGDVFASALVGALMRGKTLREAAGIAMEFVYAGIVRTHLEGTDPAFGILFEGCIPGYIRDLGERRCSSRLSRPRSERGDGTVST